MAEPIAKACHHALAQYQPDEDPDGVKKTGPQGSEAKLIGEPGQAEKGRSTGSRGGECDGQHSRPVATSSYRKVVCGGHEALAAPAQIHHEADVKRHEDPRPGAQG